MISYDFSVIAKFLEIAKMKIKHKVNLYLRNTSLTMSKKPLKIACLVITVLVCFAVFSCGKATNTSTRVQKTAIVKLQQVKDTGESWERSYNKGTELHNAGNLMEASYYFSNALGVEFLVAVLPQLFFPMVFMPRGYSDLKTANRNVLIGVGTSAVVVPIASAIAMKGAMAIAVTYGTASTGVAISSLSGAAATNAAAAWLGGGSIAGGGAGIAGAGGSVLVTGGTAIIVIVAYVGIERTIHYVSYLKEERDKLRYLREIIKLTQKRVNEYKQIEWQTVH